jgi:hypothetical protein
MLIYPLIIRISITFIIGYMAMNYPQPLKTETAACYFEHDADWIIGRGATMEQSFTAAARTMFAAITNIDAIEPHTTIPIEFVESDPELALV